jgi:hypothetical protein
MAFSNGSQKFAFFDLACPSTPGPPNPTTFPLTYLRRVWVFLT